MKAKRNDKEKVAEWFISEYQKLERKPLVKVKKKLEKLVDKAMSKGLTSNEFAMIILAIGIISKG